MILHYIQISLRNLRKYKTQTAISIYALAVSLTLMAIVSSIMLSFKPTSLLNQPYADRIEQFSLNETSRYVFPEDLPLIVRHQFKSVKEMHISATTRFPISVTANSTQENEHSLTAYGSVTDSGYLNFLGEKSVYSGEIVGSFKDNEVLITDWLAKKLYDNENPIGKTIYLRNPFHDHLTGNYIVKDVIARPSSNNEFLYSDQHIYLSTDQFEDEYCALFFLLRENAIREDLQKELEELLPNREFMLHNIKATYDETESMTIRRSIIIFLFLFVLVAFSNYLRQQTQLFRLREREMALRTCVGSQPKSLFSLFATEILVVLMLTLTLTFILISIVIGFLTSEYNYLIQDYYLDYSYPISIITMAILTVISMIVIFFTVRKIRRDQTGLALRMKPRPKHRLRNLGLITQMTICILFLWLTSLYYLSIDSIKDLYGIPEDIDKYKRSLFILGVSEEDSKNIYSRIDTLESVERVFLHLYIMTMYDPNEGFPNRSHYTEYYQNSNNDIVDFYGLDIKELPGKTNPERYVLINEDFKQMLIDKNQWNGRTVILPNRDNIEFEVKGIFDHLPFKVKYSRKDIIITDPSIQNGIFANSRIILPKEGKDKEARTAIEKIIKEELPTRVDIKIDNYFNLHAPSDYNMKTAVIAIIYILTIISVITTMAGIYSGVALDTRRRRKEMALRKLNGADRKVISMIFARTYIMIITISSLIALPLGWIFIPKLGELDYAFFIDTKDMMIPYPFILLFVIVITACTIVWKIRDIMHADPIDYLKE